MNRFNFLNAVMQLLPLHLRVGGGGGGGSFYSATTGPPPLPVDWNTDRGLRKQSS